MRFSLIICSLNGRERLHMPLERLREPVESRLCEVIVVDNGSTDGTAGFVAEHYPWARVVSARENLGFAGGNNLGILNARGDAVILLNDDTEPQDGWLEELERAFDAHPRLGVAGCRLLYPDGRIQHLGGIVHANGLTDHLAWGEQDTPGRHRPIPCDYATGAALAIRREVIAQIGLLDPGFFPIYFEEVEFCHRARRAGWRVAVVPGARVVHHESQTTGRLSRRFLRMYHRNRIRFLIATRRAGEWPATVRAELRWLVRNVPWNQWWPCALAWAWAPFHAAERLRRGRR